MMEPPQLTGEALALYNFVQAQFQEVHNAAAAVNQGTQNRLAVMEKGITAVNQRIDMASQTWETKFGSMAALVNAMGAGGIDKKKVDVTESKPVNNLKEFGGGDREQFREWTRKLVGVMQKLRPGSRTILREIDVTDKDLWNKAAHDDAFCDSTELQDTKPSMRTCGGYCHKRRLGEP